VVLADGSVLLHVAASLAEKPDGSAVRGKAEAGTKETAATGGGSRFRLENRVGERGLNRWVRCPIGCNGVSVWGLRSILTIESSSPGQRRSFDAIGPWGGGCTVQRLVLKLTQRVWSPNSFERSILRGAGVNLLCAYRALSHDSADDTAACCAGRLLHGSTLLPKERLRYPLSGIWGYNFRRG
jgi:hypothetical protein